MFRIKSFAFALFSIFIILAVAYPVSAQNTDTVAARPSANGQLSVNGAYLTDSTGRKVILRGVSLHGITWFPDFVNEERFLIIFQSLKI